MNKIRVAITMGDPAGIGPEIIAGAGLKDSRNVRYVVIGDRNVFDKAAGRRNFRLPFQFVDLANADRRRFVFGKISAKNGKASIEYLDAAMGLLGAGEIDCLVTGPISKEAVHKAGYPYSGHTEYFAARAHRPDVVMMLVNDCLKFSLVTRHVPLAAVSRKLNSRNICSTLRTTHDALRTLFGIRKPKIVVLGINPHGSDNGVIGNEENTVIRPAIRSCRFPGVSGPLGADVAITKAAAGMYDCVLAMYHDQAMIPLKLTGDRTGVNLTLGLPFVRTSPLHGTGFDIAGKHKADPASLRAAVNLALRCVQNQRKA
ncbi:MAG TPA: 4-hydroxythreonine-4-phosphate dehydrogenase PdxA [Candidatus Omnitrophota bacterium]|nr:4-hydroxythreonine-4-phosphate dehydrogenase PdxA [Candidatus Omnitrophota bacterium]HQQ06609.1 4-hydroxythreonine-4-phosphate dehydrogenase PdxA [Candidatus Omnitrophota bacterium]